MNDFNETEHPRSDGGQFASKYRAESSIALATPEPLPVLNSELAPAGTYFVGDPCYAFDHDEWDAFLDQTGLADEDGAGAARMADGSVRRAWMVGTRDGDGAYPDGNGQIYSVDSGTLGLVPLDEIEPGRVENLRQFGNIVTFGAEVTISDDGDGRLTFGHLAINTGDPDPIECYNCGRTCDPQDYCEWCGDPCEHCAQYACEGACLNCGDCGKNEDECVCGDD